MRKSLVAVCALIAVQMSGVVLADEEQGDLSVFMRMPEDALSLTHAGAGNALAPFPDGIPTLGGTDIARTLALTARIRDADGNLIGLTSELEDFPADFDEKGEQVWDTYWTVMIVGRGSLLLYEKEALGPDVAKVFAETPGSGLDWSGSIKQPSTVGPLPDKYGVVVGGTGEFEGATGKFREIGHLKRFTTDGALEAEIELRIWLE